MSYSPIDKPTDFFNSVLYTGNGSSPRSITGVGFQPDFNWTKSRSASGSHVLANSVSGANKQLVSNNNSAEATNGAYGYLSAFGSDGWTMTTGSSDFSRMNTNSTTYVSWNWLAGTSFTNDASATGIGTIDSAGSRNTDAGFSIISYTGTGSAATVAHGLGSTPKMIIVKNRSSSQHWQVYHISTGNTKSSQLSGGGGADTASTYWNNTSPTSTVFSIGTGTPTNGNGNAIIAYCFVEKQGYSKFSSYVGNGSASSGPFVYTGFKPAFVMIKRTDSTSSWEMYDAKREGFNPQVHALYANGSNAEDNTDDLLDLLSNGFKLYHDGGGLNASGSSYIFMAFASNPFTTSTGIPACAR